MSSQSEHSCYRAKARKEQGIEVEFQDDGQPKPLDEDIRLTLFRNVRELLVNVGLQLPAKVLTYPGSPHRKTRVVPPFHTRQCTL
jgi:glucose-6-phosphate-specific signal transduction histidine kinase